MIGTGELLVILGIVLLLFGGKKLPEIARNLGQGIREFKKACNGDEEVETIEVRPQTPSKKEQKESEPSEPI